MIVSDIRAVTSFWACVLAQEDTAGHHAAVDAAAERPRAAGGHPHRQAHHHLLPDVPGLQLGQRVLQVAQGDAGTGAWV